MPETAVSESEVSPCSERKGFLGIAWTILIGIGIWTILFLTAGLVVPKFSMSLLASEWFAATLCVLSVFLIYRQLMSIPQNRTALLVGMILTGGLAFFFFYLRSGFETGYRQVFFESFFHSIFLVLFVFYAGQLLALLVDKKSYLLPMIIVASVVDVWSKLQGVSKALVEMPALQEITRSIMVSIPVAVPATSLGPKFLLFAPIAGGADFLFISFFLAVSCKFGLPLRRSAIAMFIGMVVGITSVVLLHELYESGYWNFDLKGLPGIPFFAGAYLFVHWKEIRPNKHEIIQTILFLAVLGIILAIVVMGFFAPRPVVVPEQFSRKARPHKDARKERPAVPSSAIFSEDFQGAEKLEDLKDWSPVEFKNIQRHSVYSLQKDGTNIFLQVFSSNACSGLIRPVALAGENASVLKWRWRVDLFSQEKSSKRPNDFPIRLMILFESFSSREAGIELPGFEQKIGSALCYVWADALDEDSIIKSRISRKILIVVVESGRQNPGEWKSEERSLPQDYQNAFGKQMPGIIGIAVLADTDDTESVTTAAIDNIEIYE